VRKGAYSRTLGQFVQRGFISWAHDWANPIGMVTSAVEPADGLWISGQFQSDGASQRIRTLVRERLGAGKFLGLSIGYKAEEWHREGDVRVLTDITLYEVSIVTVPAEPRAHVSVTKDDRQSLSPTQRELTLAKRKLLQREVEALERETAVLREGLASRRTLLRFAALTPSG